MALQTKTYSVGDLAYMSASNAYVLDLIITEESTSVAENTSLISYKLQLRSGPNNRFSDYMTCKVSIGGTQVASCVAGIDAYYNHTYVLLTGTKTVAHNADGSLNLSVSGFIGGVSDNYYAPPDMTVSGTMALTTIPRASTVGASDAYIGSVSTVSVNKKSSAYTHSIAYKFGSLSGYLTASGGVSATQQKFSGNSVAFTVPTSFYAQIPNSPSGKCTLTCRTWSGSTQIGDAQTASFTVTARQSLCKPTVSGTVKDVNSATVALTGDASKMIRYMSNALCTITASGNQSATIKTRTIAGVSVSASRTITGMESASVVFAATDSRGYSASVTKTVELIPYIKLTANLTGKRTDPTSGNAWLTVAGKYYSGSLGTRDNALEVKYKVGSGEYQSLSPTVSNGSYTATVSLSGLDYTQSHTVTVVAADALCTVTKTLTIGPGMPVFDWGREDFAFHVPVTAPCVNGVYMAKKNVSATNAFKLTTAHETLNGNNHNRHSFFIFGMANNISVCGILSVGDGGAVQWEGSGTVTAEAVDAANSGAVTVTLPSTSYDYFTIISAKPFA